MGRIFIRPKQWFLAILCIHFGIVYGSWDGLVTNGTVFGMDIIGRRLCFSHGIYHDWHFVFHVHVKYLPRVREIFSVTQTAYNTATKIRILFGTLP